MNFVKDDNRVLDLLKEKFRVSQRLSGAGGIAVYIEAFRLRQGPHEGRLTHAPHTRQPGNGHALPDLQQASQPELTADHRSVFYVYHDKCKIIFLVLERTRSEAIGNRERACVRVSH